MDKPIQAFLTVASILFGFLFAGFRWVIDREIDFDEEERHFKLGTGMLVVGLFLVGIFGIILPLRVAVQSDTALRLCYRGIVIAFVLIYGYVLAELGHYSVYQWPKYVTKSEWFWATVASLTAICFVVKWWLWPS
jgi:hypothetical protein